jgi:Ca2+-binding RTX toxin-like protein
MRTLGLALLALAFTASPASAAVIDVEEHFCGCDGSSGDEDTATLVVTAAPGEHNVMSVERSPRGIVIKDAGAPLTGRCRPTRNGDGRFCRGAFDGVEVSLGDGDDQVRVAVPYALLSGGAGADLLDATGSDAASVTYADHTEGVTVRLNGLADDGAAGEGDDVRGPVTGITGGAGNDVLEAGPTAGGLFGAGGNDTLVGSPQGDSLHGGDGDDSLSGGGGNDHLTGADGADDLSGGTGIDEAAYGGAQPLQLSIGDGANDGVAGEGDDIRADIEWLAGGSGNDVLIGDAGANRLIAFGGQDVLRGGAGPDELVGWGDGDELDAGPGADRVQAGWLDRPLLADGETDRLDCRRHAPAIEADAFDVLRACAPPLIVRRASRVRSGGLVTLVARCPERSVVPCQGRLWLNRLHGRRVSRKVRLGPIDPGERTRLRIRLAEHIRRGACLLATTRTRRDDGLDTVTVARTAFGCLPA